MKHFFLTVLLSALPAFVVLSGCEEQKLCETNEDCKAVCHTFDRNDIFYACTEHNSCSCVAKEDLTCTGEPDEKICADICKIYAPDKLPVCGENKRCDCVDPKDIPPSESETPNSGRDTGTPPDPDIDPVPETPPAKE